MTAVHQTCRPAAEGKTMKGLQCPRGKTKLHNYILLEKTGRLASSRWRRTLKIFFYIRTELRAPFIESSSYLRTKIRIVDATPLLRTSHKIQLRCVRPVAFRSTEIFRQAQLRLLVPAANTSKIEDRWL